MTDIQRAMLGDKEAQEDLTDKWVLLPCLCGRNPNLTTTRMSNAPGLYAVLQCDCGITMTVHGEGEADTVLKLIRKWNTRPALLTPEQIKRLEEFE